MESKPPRYGEPMMTAIVTTVPRTMPTMTNRMFIWVLVGMRPN